MWKERIFVDISSCRDGDETCVISAVCLSRRLNCRVRVTVRVRVRVIK